MVDIKCKSCSRWLGKTDNTFIGVVKCSNSKCKVDNQIKIVTTSSSEEQLHYVFTQPEAKLTA